MYNIKQAAARAGVTVPVLRAWERRYRIVSPERSASGYRRFDDPSIARIRTMRTLVDEGWAPSAAAAAILAGDVPVRDEGPLSGSTPAGAGGATADSGAVGDMVALADSFVAAARDLDAELVEAVLDDLFARGSFERVASDLLFPALERLGTAWAAGEVNVAGEHLASAAVHRRLAIALEAAGTTAVSEALVMIGLPPGGRHELGALAFAVAARRAGLSVAYVGADLPLEDWVAAAAGAQSVVLGVVMQRDRRPALDVARAILASRPGMVVAFGGDAAPHEPGVIVLPDRLQDAVAALSAVLRREGR
jgi:methanogenic corrinoid protein MtbC1